MISSFKFFHGTVKTKFTVHWNPELEQDLNFYHGIDAEAELTRELSQQIANEIDNDIVRDLTRRINGGDNIRYLNHWMSIGDDIV
jgi:hypothetical protein